MTLTFDIWPWNSIGFVRLSRYMFLQNIIKLPAAVHELSWSTEKENSDEHNTVRRYRADGNKICSLTDRQYLLTVTFSDNGPEATQSLLLKQRHFLAGSPTARCRQLARCRQSVERTWTNSLCRHRQWCQVQLQTACMHLKLNIYLNNAAATEKNNLALWLSHSCDKIKDHFGN